MELVQGAMPIYEGSYRLMSLERQELLEGLQKQQGKGNEPTLALPEGADDFAVYYDARSKKLEACSDKERRRQSPWMKLFSEYGFEAKYHLGKANVDVVPWSRKKE
ncbi:hypothetical protein Tco_0110740 [Tanacetum coccineum]